MTTEQAHKRLKGTFSKDKNSILFDDYGMNYNNEPEVAKRGTTFLRFPKSKR